jgi:hypothetical protein
VMTGDGGVDPDMVEAVCVDLDLAMVLVLPDE